ncbi:hypothetical protein CYMTET_25722 [Cymbomonas tetramitiformis]|uniref:VCBS repeat-containing protein n=1 Tax=Cymbomonas tetramitiformis TaxID=36881 RepID=A0AAE0KYL8_9CHLO|nr:hypothetical protein CYMTET_25722 [Cymbomonas tetramitiformis]
MAMGHDGPPAYETAWTLQDVLNMELAAASMVIINTLTECSDDKIAWYYNSRTAAPTASPTIAPTTAAPSTAAPTIAPTTDGPAQGPTTTTSGFAARGRSLLGDDGSGRFGSQQVISTLANGAEGVYATDLDGDGDMDVLSASNFDDKIAWYANDGSGGFGSQLVITTLAKYARSVYAADVDGDGDMDVLSASFEDDKIAWYANDGSGGFGSQQLVISTVANNPLSVFVADVDGDGDMDLLSASFVDDKIAWYANDGSGGFGSQQLVISTLADNARSVYAADMDGDGDMDVLSASAWDDKIACQQVISTLADGAVSVHAADMDGDGDKDVLSASVGDDKIACQQVISTLADGARSVHAADMDGDGDMDVLSASMDDAKIAWYLGWRHPLRGRPINLRFPGVLR